MNFGYQFKELSVGAGRDRKRPIDEHHDDDDDDDDDYDDYDYCDDNDDYVY